MIPILLILLLKICGVIVSARNPNMRFLEEFGKAHRKVNVSRRGSEVLTLPKTSEPEDGQKLSINEVDIPEFTDKGRVGTREKPVSKYSSIYTNGEDISELTNEGKFGSRAKPISKYTTFYPSLQHQNIQEYIPKFSIPEQSATNYKWDDNKMFESPIFEKEKNLVKVAGRKLLLMNIMVNIKEEIYQLIKTILNKFLAKEDEDAIPHLPHTLTNGQFRHD